MVTASSRTGCRFRSQKGHAVIEVALMAPWIYFLFIGALDMGFLTHALISTQNAARTAAAYTSRSKSTAGSSTAACRYALMELQAMSNVRNLSNCNATPLVVTATAVSVGVDGSPASSVTVKYLTNRLIPIPGLSPQFTITRTVEMAVK